jgi:uncharacterized membrane protein
MTTEDRPPTIEEVRIKIDEAIAHLWATGVCRHQIGRSEWVGYALIEGLKRARALTGEQWDHTKHQESWQKFAMCIDGVWVMRREYDY